METAVGSGVERHTSQSAHLDTRAWLIWLLALLVVALMMRNPWYQLLLMGWIALTWPPADKSWRQLVWFVCAAIALGAIFNALTVHVGSTVLGAIPGDLPLLSGNITLEALAFGASNGLTIGLIILIFVRFSVAIDYASVLRYLPTALFEMGLIVSISFTLIPNMRRAWRDIQQAQALRGHRVRGIRDLPPLVVPLVVSGLERALMLAEAMEARGYARRQNASPLSRLLLSASVVGVLMLLVLNLWGGISRPLVFGGLIVCGLGLWLALHGQKPHRTRFRQGHWAWRENLILGMALIMIGAFVLAAPQDLNFSPYPRLSWPVFNPWLGVATISAVLPALLSDD